MSSNKRINIVVFLLRATLTLLAALVMLCANPPASQAETVPTSGRYITAVFSDSDIQKLSDIIYGSAQAQLPEPTDPGVTTFQQELKLDLYQRDPSQDPVAQRPAIVWIHGGAFYTGDKAFSSPADTAVSVPLFAKEFAKRGYVCVSINYRLRTQGQVAAERNLQTYGHIWDAMHDAKAAVRWLRRHAAAYHIDPDRIAIGGESAGAVTSIYAAYINDFADEGTSGNPGFASNVSAVIDLWGKIADASHLNQLSAGKAPLLIMHGTADNTIAFSYAEELKARADNEEVRVPCEWYPQAGEGHGCPSVPVATKVSLMAPFLYRYVIMPPSATASPVGGTYTSTQSVILTADEPATIYYTTDGSTPTTGSAVYSAAISINSTTTLKFFARDTAGNQSVVQTATYTIDTVAPTVTASPAGGTYPTAQEVALGANEAATIYYTTDGSTPTAASAIYTAPLSVSTTTTLKFYAVDTAWNSSPVQTASYMFYASARASGLVGTVGEQGEARTETVDVMVQQGQVHTFTATGFLSGQFTHTINRQVTIKSGSYAGWFYQVGTYAMGSYTGNFYSLTNGSDTWGMMEGDIKGVRVRKGNKRLIYVTDLQGTGQSGVVDLVLTGGTAGTTTDYTGLPLTIRQSAASVTSSGFYNGTSDMDTTLVFLPTFKEGFVLGTYQSSFGGGATYLYHNATDPAATIRKGMSTGGLFGSRDVIVPQPATTGSTFYSTISQYTGSRVRSSSTLIADFGNNRVIEVNGQQQASTIQVSDSLPLNRPIDAQRVSGDRTLISEMNGNRVLEVDASGATTWQFTDLIAPRFVERLFNGNTMIADLGNHRVMEVAPNGMVVWQYGTKGVAGSGPGLLNQPTAAYRLADSTTVIVDTYNHRVIRVKTGDFVNNPAVNYGWKDSSIVWQYGETGVAGSGPNQLNAPRRTQLLDSGNILIGDSLNHRVIEVAPDKRIIWQYGTTGVQGAGANQLYWPRSVQRLVNGDTIIADDGNHRVVEVTPRKNLIWSYGTAGQAGNGQGFLNGPKSAYDVEPLSMIPDTTPPGGQILINGGAASTTTPFVYITCQVGDNSGSVTGMRFSNDNVTWYGWQPFVNNKSWSLTPEVGSKTVYAQFRDAAGNVMFTSASVTLTSIPQLSSSLTTGTDVTAAPTPTSSLTFSDVSSPGTVTMIPANPATQPANFKVLTGASYEIATTAVHNGTIEVCIGYNDASLANPYNEGRIKLFHFENGQWIDITTSVDTFMKQVCGVTTSLSPFTLGEPTTPPVSSITSPVSGAVHPAGMTVITGTATDNSGTSIQKVEVSTNNGVTWYVASDTSGNGSWSSWSYTWAPALSGTFTLQSRATDNSGLEEIPAPGVTVTVDAVPPTVTASPAGGAYIFAQTVTLSASEPATTYYTLDGSTPTTNSAIYGSPITISSSMTLKYFGRDTAGNTSAVQSAAYTITPDSLPPSGSVVINAGVATTTGTYVMLTLSATDNSGAVAQMRFSNDGSSWGTWILYASTATWELTTGNGLKTVYAQFKDVAGNVSSLPYPSDTIQLFTAPPPVATSKVPVMNGWWLVPGMISGLLLLYRRRD